MIARFPLLVWHDQFETSVLPRRERTGANRGNGGRKENLCSLRFRLLQSKRDGDADFIFLAFDTASLAAPKSDEGGPYIDNRPLLAVGKPELREHKAVYVLSDSEIRLFSDEVVVNCAP